MGYEHPADESRVRTDPRRALVVEDTPSARMLVTALLTQQGFAVATADSGESGLAVARELDPELVVLDVGLPGTDGFSACRELRAFSDAYVLMLTAQDTELDKVIGFEAGADDYITKPFSTPEFIARVQALLRRPRRVASAPAAAPDVRTFGALTIDPGAREVTLDGVPLNLTRREFDLLEVLSGSPRVAFTRAQLLERVWGENWFGDDHLVGVHISNLRRKLGDDGRNPAFVLTVRGIGFRMGPGR
jgi:DNA-binding response OmpR family regulator